MLQIHSGYHNTKDKCNRRVLDSLLPSGTKHITRMLRLVSEFFEVISTTDRYYRYWKQLTQSDITLIEIEPHTILVDHKGLSRNTTLTWQTPIGPR